MEKLIIVGTSTTAETVYKFILNYNLFQVLGFAVDDRKCSVSEEFCGLPVYEFENLPSTFNKQEDFLFVAIQWNRLNAVRRDVYNRLKSQSFKFANIISPNAILHTEISGDNCWICDGVVLENDVTIHSNVFIKTKATVLHFSEIHNHCFIGANSLLAGYSSIGEQTYIGVSSTIFDGVNIGRKCLIGAGVLVKRHTPSFTIVKSNNVGCTIIQSNEDEIENKLLVSLNIR